MYSNKAYLLIACSALALSACGSSGGKNNRVVIGEQEELARVFSDTSGDLGDVLTDGQLVTARQIAMAGINLNYNENTTELTEMTEFRVQENADGEFTLWLNGSEWAFTPADIEDPDSEGRVFGYFNQEQCDTTFECVSLFNWNGELDDLKSNGNGYHAVLNSQSNQVNGGQPDVRAFAVVGTETRDDALSSLGTATYSGYSNIDAYPDTGFEDNSSSRTRLRSDLTMSADFGAGTISGTLDNMQIRDPGETDYTSIDGTMTMEQTNFSVNGFKGDLTADADFTASTGATLDGSSNYAGVFYGPSAEEVGGVISASGSSEGEDFNAIGMFTGNINE